MERGGQSGQRWRAAIVVGIALLMMAVGLTVLSPFLRGLGYIIYWLICIVFTFLALIFALLDLQQLRQRSRDEQRELIKRALDDLPEAPNDQRRRREE